MSPVAFDALCSPGVSSIALLPSSFIESDPNVILPHNLLNKAVRFDSLLFSRKILELTGLQEKWLDLDISRVRSGNFP